MEIEREEEIRGLAYKIWEQEGYPHGHDIEHWLYAEAIWQEKHRQKRNTKQSKPLKRTKSRKTEAAAHKDSPAGNEWLHPADWQLFSTEKYMSYQGVERHVSMMFPFC